MRDVHLCTIFTSYLLYTQVRAVISYLHEPVLRSLDRLVTVSVSSLGSVTSPTGLDIPP